MIKISRRSVAYIQYEPDESLTEPAAYAELKNRVIEKDTSSVKIELEGIRNEKFVYTTPLPILDR